MVCFSLNNKPPQPPRVWSRLQSRCSTTVPSEDNNPLIFFPLTNEIIPLNQAAARLQMIEKGNVLQYKKNSSDITRKQRYAAIQKGQWVSRSKTYATQNILVSDPNIRGLKRVNYTTIYADDGTPANLPVTCPTPKTPVIPKQLPINFNIIEKPIQDNNIFPNQPSTIQRINEGNSIEDPYYPEGCPQYVDPRTLQKKKKKKKTPKKRPKKKTPKKKIIIPVIKPPLPPPEREVIPDGGDLVCVTEDICGRERVSGQQQAYVKPNYCNPTTSSDVPGPIQDLCFNSLKMPTHYARQRYKMPSSGGNKFPVGYKFDLSQETEPEPEPAPAPEPEPVISEVVNINVSSSGYSILLTLTTEIYQQPTFFPNSSIRKDFAVIVYDYDPVLVPVGSTDMFILSDGEDYLIQYNVTIVSPDPTYGPSVFLNVTSSPETIAVTTTSSVYQQTTSPASSVAKVGDDTIVYTYDSTILMESSTDMFVLIDGDILTEYQITIGSPVISSIVNLNVSSSPWEQPMVSTIDVYQQPTMSPSSSVTKIGDTIVYTYDSSVTTDMFLLKNGSEIIQYNVTIETPYTGGDTGGDTGDGMP